MFLVQHLQRELYFNQYNCIEVMNTFILIIGHNELVFLDSDKTNYDHIITGYKFCLHND